MFLSPSSHFTLNPINPLFIPPPLPPSPTQDLGALSLPSEAEAAAAVIRGKAEGMHKSSEFHRQEDGETALWLIQFEDAREDMGEEGGFACATNEAFSRHFRSALALVGDAVVYRSLHSLLLSA